MLLACIALSACNARNGVSEAEVRAARDGEPLGPPPPVALASQQMPVPPPHRSRTVLVVAPEYPPLPALDGNVELWLRTPYVTKGSRFEVGKLDGIAQASCFVSASGTRVPAHGREPEKTGRETDGHRFELLPDSPLAADRWYSLLIRTDEFLRAADAYAPAPAPGNAAASDTWSWPFFNGSAPRIVAVRSHEAAEAPSLEVVFSEPLQITDALCQTLVGNRRPPADRACESQRGQLASSVHLQLKPADSVAITPLELRLFARARGRGRSVAEAAPLLHRPPIEPSVLRLTASDLAPCDSARCWREPTPPELASAPRACD